jgi:hypothetical protein
MEILSSISASIEIVKKLRVLGKAASEADFKLLLADLTDQLGDAKIQAADLKLELAKAKERVGELEREAGRTAASEPDLHEGAYIFGDPSRHYCTGCFDSGGRKVLLTELGGPFTVFGKWSCPVCEKTFGK